MRCAWRGRCLWKYCLSRPLVISFVPRCHDGAGHRSRKPRLPEGVSGIARLHALVGRFLPEDVDGAAVKIGIETDRGPWVAALVPARATVSREPRAMPVMLLSRRPGRDRLPRWWPPGARCTWSTGCSPLVPARATVSREPRAMPVMLLSRDTVALAGT